MKTQADIKYLRISPKKVKPLAQAVVGMEPDEAIDKLKLTGEKAGRMLGSAIKSALYNALNNHKLKKESLKVKKIEVAKGPFFKRFRPVARGMAHPYKKYTSHIKVVLEEEDKKE